AIYWAAGKEDEFAENWICDNPAIEVAYYPQSGLLLAANCDEIEAAGVITDGEREITVEIGPLRAQWIEL
ncbi:MAG: 1,3-beta-galactosyl-N-acetylhexosamine phosphorylase C-terminal domain-containing protein, partial [Arcanobacterium sp.]|nr:1,3-beta-galactosyl-N-acetylhexosamine phosphorylase C-terminal domain-containing protein [Arcanobacterium sp.]